MSTTTLASGKKKTNLSSPMANTSSPLCSSSPLLMIPKVLPLTMRRKRPTQLDIPDIKPARTEYSIFRDFAHQNDAVSLGGNGFGLVSRKGKKKFMEDSHRVVPCLLGNSKKGFFGVYDGHGGGKAAEFVAENLHKHVLEMMKKNCKEKDEKVEAFKAAYLRTDRDFLEQGVVSGACCVTALIQDQEMIVSNLGDCRAVLCRAGVAEALTADHKAGRDDEKLRIESQGGYVDLHRGAWRVNGTLAVSRSIGDANLKKWVIAEPETRILKLEQDMEFLVLASDGLWDVVSNQDAVDTVLHVLAQRKTPTESEAENLGQGHVNVSPSSKLRRVSLVDSPPVLSPICAKSPSSYNNSENEPPSPHCENGSPLSKLRRTTPVRRMKMDSESSWAKAACKELTNLAMKKGNMDDVTVVIIDLDHYKC
ncbi:PREDICTED: probable protein phosphatase 2C 14 [Camelina sativa]|uniref:protein-serine/threonine phosphatase n=1 Tax=Camelina sativa TaxID=90675 RepID=A0ABM0SS62_CAMSA|nr:PREDICTED: probable protein phosphatase 2C 14 [Camelina sativa]